jgi:adenine/guanine phosphoribosyltransferase-like PRPP-binding protein
MKKKLVKKKPRPIKHEIKTDYLGSVYGSDFLKKIPLAVKKLRALKKILKFDAIAFTGNSGAGFGFPLSFLLKIPVINVRKRATAHYEGKIEGTISSKRYLIVDDFISTGNTIKRINTTISNELFGHAKPVGIFLYDSDRLADFGKLPVYTLPRGCSCKFCKTNV